jgi:formate hydrogenlyase subunit 4
MMIASILHILLAMLLAPLLIGIINRVKARFAGRTGQSLFQMYFDIAKLLRKSAVYSDTTTWVFRAGPVVGLSAVLVSLTLIPLGGVRAGLAFQGDLLMFAYLLGLMRLVTILAALDTGSAFEGMGASREAQFSMLTEPALLLGLAAAAVHSQSISLSGMTIGLPANAQASFFGDGLASPAMLLVAGAFLVVVLAENARIPVDDPNTHLELTMIHEVMVLDHSGVDLGLIQYASALKLWVLSALLIDVLCPVHTPWPMVNLAVGIAMMLALSAVIGVIESTMARLKLLRVPQLLVAASVLAALALAIVLR